MRHLTTACLLFGTALLSVLLPGVATGQVGGGGGTQLTCFVNTANTPTLRAEGVTEAAGDIVISCTGGQVYTDIGTGGATNPIAPFVNITVSLTSQVTSRLLNSSAVSEARLLIDEPNSGLAGPIPNFGPNQAFTACTFPSATQGGCAGSNAGSLPRADTYILTQTGTDTNTYQTAVSGAPTAGNVNTSSVTLGAAPNVYQGVVSGNQVTFYGVPVVPPGTSGARVFRITNLRVNANGIGGGSPSGSLPVQAAILTSNPSALPLANPTPIVGFTQASLSTSAATPTLVAACNSQTLKQAAILTYKELFASAFKTRVDPTVPGQRSGQSSALVQDRPGTIYNSESGFTLAAPGSAPAGLANFGTRFKAVFRNVPKGARVFVSLTNVTVDPATGLATGPVANSSPSFAELVTGETRPFSVPMPGARTPGTNIELVEINSSHENRTATAVWEIVNTSPTAIDTLHFGVFVSYAKSLLAQGPATVDLGYASTNAVTAEEEDDENPVVIPRFSAGPTQPVPFLQPCGGREGDR